MNTFDFKKEYKDLYVPKTSPAVISVPAMNFIMIEGKGDPNEEDGPYQQALQLLYGLSYTIKMSKKSGSTPKGYFDYIVPPLEGLWWMEDGGTSVDYAHKDKFCWISMIRQPDFVTEDVFAWACDEVKRKKQLEASSAKLISFEEGICVQCMHIGAYDDETATVAKIEEFIQEQQLKNDIGTIRRHHEIYLSDPRKGKTENRKTVLRIPVK